ncbi:MAG: hypothetical protein IT373_22295 [Polyangiaceae bacterium]|nr:hypothetical protein [Polyangiaceae bacterium]
MWRICGVLGLSLVACKGPKPAQTGPAASGEPAASSTASAQAAPGDTGSHADPEPATTGAAHTGRPSSDELRTILQLVLDDSELDGYLHLGSPDRFPLKIAGEGLPDGLVKATKPVVVVTAPAADAPVLVFTEIDASADRATVRYRFGAENIRGTATLEKSARGWQLVQSRIIER